MQVEAVLVGIVNRNELIDTLKHIETWCVGNVCIVKYDDEVATIYVVEDMDVDVLVYIEYKSTGRVELLEQLADLLPVVKVEVE